MSTFDTLNQLTLNLTSSETLNSSLRKLKQFNPLENLSKSFLSEENSEIPVDEAVEETTHKTTESEEAPTSDESIASRLQGIVAGMFDVAQNTYRETLASNDEDDRTKEQVTSWFSKVISDASKSSLLPLLVSGVSSKSNPANLIPLALTLLKTFEQKPEVEEPTDPFKKFQQDIAASAKGFTGALLDLAQNISKGR